MSLQTTFRSLLREPPPTFAFEISAEGIAMARTAPQSAVQFVAYPSDTVQPSPISVNVRNPVAYAEAVSRLVPAGVRGRKAAALILPDNSARVSILDFETLPEKEEERDSLVRFRLRKALPFDVEKAAISYVLLGPSRLLAAVSPAEVIAEYEAPFRALGLHPGLITLSCLAMVDLVPPGVSTVIAKLSAGALTVLALEPSGVSLVRSIDLHPETPDVLEEIANDLYPTLAYIEDHTGARPQKLLLAGFGEDSATAETRLAIELELETEALKDMHPGLAGYLESLHPTARGKKAAA